MWSLAHACRRANVATKAARCITTAIRANVATTQATRIAQPNNIANRTVRCLSTSSVPPVGSAAAKDPFNNVTAGVASKIGRNLHLIPGHPLNIIKNRIEYYFNARAREMKAKEQPGSKAVHDFKLIDNLSPIVTAKQNFDDLLVAPDHPGRSPSDTFYYSKEQLLRTHTSAHQHEFMKSGLSNFLILGDCYRRDEIDSSHYPVFHQMEGVKVFSHDVATYNRGDDGVALVVEDLKATLDGLVRYLFGSDIEVRWIDAYFPFTHPSFEMEILFQGEWLEVFGCGVIQYPILDACAPPLVPGVTNGWAFGLGLERLAMVLFNIPDIRLFWSEDPRFLDQFSKVKEDLDASGGVFKKITFQPFSKYPPCPKDVAFWVPQETAADGTVTDAFHENDFCSMVREIAGDIVENVTLIDSFTHPKTKQASKCYRIMYRSLNRNLTNEEVDVLQEQVRKEIVTRLGCKLR